MKKEHMMDAMGWVDPALVAAADAPARGRRRWVRPILAAACLCLALVGTAVAAQVFEVYVDLQTNPAHGGENYTAKGGFTFFPADSFPQQVHDLAATAGLAGRNFKTWAELEEFLGRDLPDSTALDAARPGPRATVEGKGNTHILLVVSTADQGLASISAEGNYLLDGVWIQQSANLYTDKLEQNYQEYAPEGVQFDGGRVMIYDEGSVITEESYTTPGGLTATIVGVAPPEGSAKLTTDYNAHFSIGGISYMVRASFYPVGMTAADAAANDDPTHTLEVLKTVLDGFDLN